MEPGAGPAWYRPWLCPTGHAGPSRAEPGLIVGGSLTARGEQSSHDHEPLFRGPEPATRMMLTVLMMLAAHGAGGAGLLAGTSCASWPAGMVISSVRLVLIVVPSRDTPPGRSLGAGARGAAGSADRAEPTRTGCHERYWLISLLSA